MNKQYPKGLRTTFLVHAVMMSIFALIYIFFPILWGDLTGCLSNQVPQVFRMFGTAIFGLAISSFLAYSQQSWEAVKVIAQTEVILNLIFPVMVLLGLLFWDLPNIGWMYFVVMIGFGVGFNLFYFKA